MSKNSDKSLNLVIVELLSELYKADAYSSDETVLRLGLLLEKMSPYSSEDSFYKNMLPSDLWDVEIDEPEISEIIRTFENLVTQKRLLPTILIFAKGLKHDKEILDFLLDHLSNNKKVFGESDILESLKAIDHFLFVYLTVKVNEMPENIKLFVGILEHFTRNESEEVKRFSTKTLSKIHEIFEFNFER